MTIKGKAIGIVAAGALIALFAGSANAMLLNSSFESPDASANDVPGTDDWATFETVFTNSNLFDSGNGGPVAHDGTQTLKMFGPFIAERASGASQNVAVTAGTPYEASVWAQNWSGDALTNLAILQLIFKDAAGLQTGAFEVVGDTTDDGNNILLASDVWTQLTVSGTAPVDTVSADVFLLHVQINPITGGSVFWDDASLTVVPVPAAVWLFGSALGLLGVVRRRMMV